MLCFQVHMHVLAADCRFQLHKQQSGFIYFFYHFLINLNMRKHFIYFIFIYFVFALEANIFSFFPSSVGEKSFWEPVKIFKLLNRFTFSFFFFLLFFVFLTKYYFFLSVTRKRACENYRRFSRFTLSRALKFLKCRGSNCAINSSIKANLIYTLFAEAQSFPLTGFNCPQLTLNYRLCAHNHSTWSGAKLSFSCPEKLHFLLN